MQYEQFQEAVKRVRIGHQENRYYRVPGDDRLVLYKTYVNFHDCLGICFVDAIYCNGKIVGVHIDTTHSDKYVSVDHMKDDGLIIRSSLFTPGDFIECSYLPPMSIGREVIGAKEYPMGMFRISVSGEKVCELPEQIDLASIKYSEVPAEE